MPYHDPDPTDPNLLVGVELPATAESTLDMASVFAEEYVRMGFDKEQILRIFKRSFYAGAHRAFLELGHEKIEEIVDECLLIWGHSRLAENEVGVKRNH
ncbi:MAG: hypothetical protein ACE5HI_04745 [bacterium]